MSVTQNVVWHISVNLPCEHENNMCSVVAIIHRCELYPGNECYFFKYLFIWPCWVLVVAYGIFIASCGISGCSVQSLVVTGRLSCWGCGL